MDIRRAIRNALGGGADISIINPLPISDRPGGKAVAGLLNRDTILAGTTSTLYNCVSPVNLNECPRFLALTIEARYDVAATQGIKVHVITSIGDSVGGTHTAGVHATIMTDDNAHFRIPDGLVGLTIVNETDGSSGVITANTETTVTVLALGGGVTNQWNTDDIYYITGAGYDTEDFDTWEPGFVADTFIRQTKVYEPDPVYMKVLIENMDPAQDVTDVSAFFTYENRT